jgi:hypothetical protein
VDGTPIEIFEGGVVGLGESAMRARTESWTAISRRRETESSTARLDTETETPLKKETHNSKTDALN